MLRLRIGKHSDLCQLACVPGNTLTAFYLFYCQAVSKNDVLNLFFDTPRSLFAHNLSKVYGGATLVREISPETRSLIVMPFSEQWLSIDWISSNVIIYVPFNAKVARINPGYNMHFLGGLQKNSHINHLICSNAVHCINYNLAESIFKDSNGNLKLFHKRMIFLRWQLQKGILYLYVRQWIQ